MDLPPLPQQPTIDVLISTFNEERYIERCLDDVLGQDYPAELIHVWLIDGGSTDATIDIVRARAEREPRLTVIADGVRRNLPESLNIAIARGTADLVAKIDAHGHPDRDFLRRAVEVYHSAEADVACVGGRPTQLGETRFGRAVALARGSRFGVGGGVYGGKDAREWVVPLQCGVYRREPLERVGMFDPAMNYGEDEEVNWRLWQAGHRVLLDTRINFNYITRPTWKAAYRQYRNYGEARVRVIAKDPKFMRVYHLVPGAFVAGLAALALAAPVSRLARRALGLTAGTYAAAALAAAARAARRGEPALAPEVAACFVALHFGYGIGMLRGLRALLAPAAQGDGGA